MGRMRLLVCLVFLSLAVVTMAAGPFVHYAKVHTVNPFTVAGWEPPAIMQFGAADVDTDGYWNVGAPDRLVIPAGLEGWYLVSVSCVVATQAGGQVMLIYESFATEPLVYPQLTTTSMLAWANAPAVADGRTTLSWSGLLYLRARSALRFWVRNGTGRSAASSNSDAVSASIALVGGP